MTASPVIECRQLCKRFDSGQVLDHLDLEVLAGETLVVLGSSGSGKSVLLKHLNGLIRPDSGSVVVAGSDLAKLRESELFDVRRKIGMLFQGGALFDSLTVADNIAFALDEQRIGNRAERAERVRYLLDLVGLAGTEAHMPAELSGGMRKRAALARSLALQPDIILYDEPTTGLDPVTGQQINLLIRDLQSRLGLTSVVVTHDLASATFIANRLAFLYDGKIRETGPVKELQRSGDPVIRTFLSGGRSGG